MNHCTGNDQEKSVKCNLIFLQGAEVEKKTASKPFLKARLKALPSECLRAGLFSNEAPCTANLSVIIVTAFTV